MGSSSPMSPPDNSKGCDSGAFRYIPEEIILDIANYLGYFDIRVLEQVCKHLFAITRSKWPPNSIMTPNSMFLCILVKYSDQRLIEAGPI
jgi:hypothetical protein